MTHRSIDTACSPGTGWSTPSSVSVRQVTYSYNCQMIESGSLHAIGDECFRVGPSYVAYWMHEFTHWESTPNQKQAADHLEESLLRLLEKRDELQLARGAFAPVSVYYPESRPTRRQQNRLFAVTADFFQNYYSAVSAFTGFIKRHADVFGDAPHNSVARFLKWYETRALFPEGTIPLLEDARAFRALLDHSASHQPYNWHTVDVSPGFCRIVLVGSAERQAQVPPGAEMDQEEAKWSFIAPDEDLLCWALSVQLNATVPVISGHRDYSSSYGCSWAPTVTDDDVSLRFPIFVAPGGGGTVATVIHRETVVQTAVAFEGSDPREDTSN